MATPRKPMRRKATSQVNQTPDVDREEEDILEDDEDTADEPAENDEDGSEDQDAPQTSPEPFSTAEEPLEPMRGAPRDGRTYRVGEKVVFPGIKKGGLIVVQEPIYRGVKTPGTDRWRFHLLLGRGAEIPQSKVKDLKDGDFESREDLLH